MKMNMSFWPQTCFDKYIYCDTHKFCCERPTYLLSIIYCDNCAGAQLICKCQAVASVGETFAGKRVEVVNQSSTGPVCEAEGIHRWNWLQIG